MAFPTRLTMAQLNDQYIQLDGLADGLTAAPISAATLTVTLINQSGGNVASMTGISMAAVGGLPGSYRGLVTNAFDPPLGSQYTAAFDGTNGGFKIHIELPVTVAKRLS